MFEISRFRSLGFLAALILVFAPTRVQAQLSSATVTGIVRDSSGSVVPSAKVVLKSADTTAERTALSNSAGNYVFLSVPPGSYSIEATATGFEVTKISK